MKAWAASPLRRKPVKVRHEVSHRRVLFLSGDRSEVDSVCPCLISLSPCDLIPCSLFAESGGMVLLPRALLKSGETEDRISALILKHNITDVVVEWATEASAKLRDDIFCCLLMLKSHGIRVHESSHFCERVNERLPLHHESVRGLISESKYHFSHRWKIAKRVVDVVGAICALLLTAPLFIVVPAAIVATSPGRVFYRQDRVGLNGRMFRIVKFRSMYADAEKGQARFATLNDDRITPVGRVLRSMRIDELPQLFNVLIGDMSLIGPRPERPMFVDIFRQSVPFYDLRHAVKPGISGWAQVKDPYASSDIETQRKLSRDLYYIKKGSIWLDIKIMIMTILVMIMRKGSR